VVWLSVLRGTSYTKAKTPGNLRKRIREAYHTGEEVTGTISIHATKLTFS
jgi:hypothetical protein